MRGNSGVDIKQDDTSVVQRYHAKYGLQDQIFRNLDRLVAAVVRSPQGPSYTAPKRLLIVNAGHIGDVIMSTALLPVLHDAFPGIEIGFLTGSYSRHIVDPHPLVARCHVIDHWYLSRAAEPRWRKILRYGKLFPQVAQELRKVQYDIAIDVRAWFPNLAPLLWQAAIPTRIAYSRVGGRPLLTRAIDYPYRRAHEIDLQLELLQDLHLSPSSLAKAWPVLAPTTQSARQQAANVLGETKRYRILHPSASTPTRDWPVQNWQALAQELITNGITPVITGSGPAADSIADLICLVAPNSINAVNAVDWNGLVALIEGAEAVYAVETSVGHAASALRRPVISIYGGMADPVQWAPRGAAVATHALDCHPCLNKSGCKDRRCLTQVSLDDVRRAARSLSADLA